MSYDPPSRPTPPEPSGEPGAAGQSGRPGGSGSAEPPGGIPASVRRAVRLMYAGAVLSVASLLTMLLMLDELRSLVARTTSLTRPVPGIPREDLIRIFWQFVITLVVAAFVIGTVLWVWMALKNRQGRRWARVTATVFFVLSTLPLLGTLSSGPTGTGAASGTELGGADVTVGISGAGVVMVVLSVGSWIVGLAAVIYLWRGESEPHFQRAGATGSASSRGLLPEGGSADDGGGSGGGSSDGGGGDRAP